MTVKIAGSYFILAALCISSGETQSFKKLLVRLWSKEIQGAVKIIKKKRMNFTFRQGR